MAKSETLNWQNQIVNWQMLQTKHAWQNKSFHYNLYLYAQDDFNYLRIIDFLHYYFEIHDTEDLSHLFSQSRVFKVTKFDRHVFSFQEFSPHKHSICLWNEFEPNEFSSNELRDVYLGKVLRRGTRFIFPHASNSIRASIIFVSKKDPRVSAHSDEIRQAMLIVEAKHFLGSNLYSDMRLSQIGSEIVELDYETRKKFVSFWFENMIDFHLEFYSDLTRSMHVDYMKHVKRRFLYSLSQNDLYDNNE